MTDSIAIQVTFRAKDLPEQSTTVQGPNSISRLKISPQKIASLVLVDLTRNLWASVWSIVASGLEVTIPLHPVHQSNDRDLTQSYILYMLTTIDDFAHYHALATLVHESIEAYVQAIFAGKNPVNLNQSLREALMRLNPPVPVSRHFDQIQGIGEKFRKKITPFRNGLTIAMVLHPMPMPMPMDVAPPLGVLFDAEDEEPSGTDPGNEDEGEEEQRRLVEKIRRERALRPFWGTVKAVSIASVPSQIMVAGRALSVRFDPDAQRYFEDNFPGDKDKYRFQWVNPEGGEKAVRLLDHP